MAFLSSAGSLVSGDAVGRLWHVSGSFSRRRLTMLEVAVVEQLVPFVYRVP